MTPFLVQSLPAAIPPAREPQAQPTSIEELSRQLVAQHPEALFYEQALAPSPLAPSPRAADADAVAAWSAEVGQPFPWAGRLALRKALANRDRALAELGLARFRSALAGRVRTLALDTIVAAEQTRITREVANRLLVVRTVLLERIPAGVAPTLEVRMVEAAEASLRRQADDAALDEREARSELNRLRRAPAESPLAVRMPPSWWSWPECPPLDRLRAAAETNHFEWRARLAELAAQGILPQGAPRSPNHASAPTNLPLLRTPGATGTSSAAAQALRRQQAATLVEVARREQEEVLARAARTYAARRTTLSRWGTNGLPQFQSTAELADRSYRNGAIPIALYVEAQRQWAETASAFLQTQRDLMQTAAHLEELTGLSLAVPSPTDPVEP